MTEPVAAPPAAHDLAQDLTLDLALASAADTHTRADWEKLAAAVLRKAGRLSEADLDSAVWDRLTRTTLDGIPVAPLGTPDLVTGLATSGRPDRAGDWDIRAHAAEPDPAAARTALLSDLENGATSLWLQVGETGLGLDDLAAALEGVLLDVAAVVLEAPEQPVAAARALVALRPEAGFAPGTNLGADPIGRAFRDDGGPVEEIVGEVAGLALEAGTRALVVDGTVVHDLGASDAQELGYAMAVGARYLRILAAAGHDVAGAAGLVEFRLAATDEQFPTIAKLRAARRLWARMLELSGVPPEERSMSLHVVTSRPMMSRYDPWVNMLRTCVAAFAAGVGGADAVTVLPFDAPLGLPEAFGRRIARNTSSLLISEAHVARVADPAGGAFAVERLTDDLAAAGWAELGRIEEGGGILDDAGLRARVAEVRAERDREVATRKRPLTGLSEFPHLHETIPERRPYAHDAAPVQPYGHAFEALRDDPATTSVYLATMGTVAAHTGRATFATNLFAAGGIDVVNAGRHDDTAAVLADYGGQPVVCLTGADGAYAAWGAELVAALRDAGAAHLVLAGKPVDGVAVDDTCAVGLDALDFLTRTRAQLEESR